MTREEIVRDYREAKNQKKQIRILADRNRTTPQAIRELLREAGVALPAPGFQPPALPAPVGIPRPGADITQIRAARLIGLVEQGASAEEIADALGVSYGQALTWVARLCVICEEYIAAAEGGAPV